MIKVVIPSEAEGAVEGSRGTTARLDDTLAPVSSREGSRLRHGIFRLRCAPLKMTEGF